MIVHGDLFPDTIGKEAYRVFMPRRNGMYSNGSVSEDIIHAGYGIYSTLCIIRDHNEWAARNLDKLQQTFHMILSLRHNAAPV